MLYDTYNSWKDVDEDLKGKIFSFSDSYKHYLDISKTEREFVSNTIKLAEENGFKDANSIKSVNPGDKLYYVNRNKNIALVVVGSSDLKEGVNFIVSHLDSPRIDLKQQPLYEDSEFAMMKTQYYGGVKKYQWASRSLALHGVISLENGKNINIVIGEKEDEPVFLIPDLLPHLGKSQRERKVDDALKGEELNIIIGSTPYILKEKEVVKKFKYMILDILNKKYGIKEEDFISSELELVPSEKARDVGLDRALVGAYGQDDRICAYTSLRAILDLKEVPKKTAVCFLVDKEEVGSPGSTGARSNYLEYMMLDLLYKVNKKDANDYFLKKLLWNSSSLSSDVNTGLNPNFKQVNDPLNVAKLSHGIILTKFTGRGGKSGSNDADAEYIASLRNLFNKNKIKWQTGMFGKVDEGGAGTIALFLAHYGIRTIDAGAALLSMHSPMEISSKFDIYELYRAYKVFFALKD